MNQPDEGWEIAFPICSQITYSPIVDEFFLEISFENDLMEKRRAIEKTGNLLVVVEEIASSVFLSEKAKV